jgi:multidrug resistance efflux pump
VLKELCKLASRTRGRHAEVVEKFRELVARRKSGKKGVIFGDIEELRVHFTPPVELGAEMMDVDEDEEMRGTSEEEGEGSAPRLPSRSYFSPDPQYETGVQHTASEHYHDAPGSTQHLQQGSNSLVTATYELDAAINALSEAEALLEHAKNERAQVLSDRRASQMDVLQAKLAVSHADRQLCIANENITLMRNSKYQTEVSRK